jgi:hypothetical protein
MPAQMLQFPQLVTQLGQGGAALGGATAGQPYYFNASRQVESVQATCSMRLTETAAPPRQIADLAAQAGTPTMPPPPAAAAAAVATAAAAAPPPPAHEPQADDYLRPRPARPAEPAAQPPPVPAMRPPAFANPAALGGMPHWFSPPAFAKPAPAAPAPLPAVAPSEQARRYEKPNANVFTVPPVPAHRRAAAQQAAGSAADLSPRINVSHLAALSAVPDAALSAQLAAAARQREQVNAASSGARPGGYGSTAPHISPTWLLDSLTVEEFVSLRNSRERELSSRELTDFTCGANSLDSTLLEDAGRLNLSSFNGLASLLDAL